jgi:hypothetical protein
MGARRSASKHLQAGRMILRSSGCDYKGSEKHAILVERGMIQNSEADVVCWWTCVWKAKENTERSPDPKVDISLLCETTRILRNPPV